MSIKKKIKKNKLLLSYDEVFGDRVKDDPEFRYHYLLACLEEAGDPEASEAERRTALMLAKSALQLM